MNNSDAEVLIPAPLNWGRTSHYAARAPHATGSTGHAHVRDDTGCRCVESSPALAQHTQKHTIPSQKHPNPLSCRCHGNARENPPAFDVLICLKHAKCHSEAGELRRGAPDCPEDGRLSEEQGLMHTGSYRCRLPPQLVLTGMLLFLCSSSPT